MEPFQALYFVRHNLRRIATVLVMVALTGLLYVGGSYLSNIEVEFLKVTDRHREFAYVNLVSSAIEDSLKNEILTEIAEDETLKLIPVGGNDYRFPTVMSFENGDYAFSYTAEDFLWINAYLRLPTAYRSLSRPSSAISALASTLRSCSLDLALFRSSS